MRLQLYTKESRQQRQNLGMGKVTFPREEHINWLLSSKWSAWKQTGSIHFMDCKIYNYQYVDKYTCINEIMREGRER